MRCWYTRWQLSQSLERGDFEARIARGHVARCAACQAHGHALAALHAQLCRGVPRAPVPVAAPRSLHRRLRVAAPLAFGAAAVLVVITAGEPVPQVAEQGPPLPVAGAIGGMRGVADQVERALASTPLDTELDALVADGKRGLDAVLSLGGLGRADRR
jgi:hypothetical protein